jgi:hypothetical protein
MTTYPICFQRAAQWGSVELGTGTGALISEYGCAMCAVCSLCEYFGKATDPSQFNQALINVKGYAFNGTTAYDIIDWSAVNRVYGDISLLFNNAYPTKPADMNLIDAQLAKFLPVIVGVSFSHDRAATEASHYVVLYQKNSDATYQCMDPWTGDKTNFNARYAVNGMTVAQCILQAISYTGPIPAQSSEIDELRTDRDANWTLATTRLAALTVTPDPSDKPGTGAKGVAAVKALTQRIADLTTQNAQLAADLQTARNDAATAHTQAAAYNQEESAIAGQLLDAQHVTQPLQQTVAMVREKLKLPETASDSEIFTAIDALMLPNDEAAKVYTQNMDAALAAATAGPDTPLPATSFLSTDLGSLFGRFRAWIGQHRGR